MTQTMMKAADGITFTDADLIPIWEKVRQGERLSFDDGVQLFTSPDFAAVGKMADYVKTQQHGDKVYFVLNRHVNPTNICVLSCSFCDFAKKKGDAGAYEMSIEDVLESIHPETREVHIVGGHHPTWPFEYYVDMVRAIHRAFPQVQVKAFTAAEIDYFWRRWKVPPAESLARLKEAGLESMPGGGAEVFSSRVQKELFPGKSNADRWAEIHTLAHEMGIPTNCTMLYGHIETYEERVNHLIRLREIQDEAPGFLAFIPLQYQVGDTKLVERHASPIEDLRTVAAARLLLDNIPHIKAYWVVISEATASVALNFGANDLDGTIGKERIAHAAQATSPAGLARERMVNLIKEAGKLPVERDALYNVVKVYAD